MSEKKAAERPCITDDTGERILSYTARQSVSFQNSKIAQMEDG